MRRSGFGSCNQLFPNSAEYNVPVVVRLRGRLDERSLQCALAAVVERHEILRSHVATFEGRPALVADAPGPVSVAFHDLTDDAAVAEVLAAATGAPFDLAAGPAMRADLLRLGTEDHLLALTFHHLVFDGWSVGVLIRELEPVLRRLQRRQHPHPPFAPHPVRRLRGLAA